VRRLLLAAACVIALTACGADRPSAVASGGPINVVATTTVFADILRSVGGDLVTVDSIVPAGASPEDYEPRPDDARRLAAADLIVSNGVGLDDFLGRLIDAAGASHARRLVLGDGIPTLTVQGRPNPHFWLDPSLVERHFLPAIRTALTELRPASADTIAAATDAYAAKLRALDTADAATLGEIPLERRKLVTFHDAFPYFAAHYGFELIGVILHNPGQEPSAADLAALVRTVKSAGVTAVFSEAQFDPKLARTLADEAGITKVVSNLYNDSLGPPPADSYLGLMTWDVEHVAGALR
jgi:zinc/manganese transport system substrate-binding protein/manganese/iron transport system substrate-binding protein